MNTSTTASNDDQALIDAIEIWGEKDLRPVARKFDLAARKCELKAAMAKLAGSEAGVFCAQGAMRNFGGYRHAVEYEIERYCRDGMLMCVAEGRDEILRTGIARQRVDRDRI